MIDLVIKLPDEAHKLLKNEGVDWLGAEHILDAVANGKPLPKGQWVDGDAICPCCGKDKYENLDADIYTDWQPKFCPNCGAKMKLSERRLLLVNKCDLT